MSRENAGGRRQLLVHRSPGVLAPATGAERREPSPESCSPRPATGQPPAAQATGPPQPPRVAPATRMGDGTADPTDRQRQLSAKRHIVITGPAGFSRSSQERTQAGRRSQQRSAMLNAPWWERSSFCAACCTGTREPRAAPEPVRVPAALQMSLLPQHSDWPCTKTSDRGTADDEKKTAPENTFSQQPGTANHAVITHGSKQAAFLGYLGPTVPR